MYPTAVRPRNRLPPALPALIAAAALASSPFARPAAADSDRERAEKALAVVWSDLSADHARVRRGGTEAAVRDFAPKLRLALLEAASASGAVLDEAALRAIVRRAKSGVAFDLSAAAVAHALARRVPPDPKQWLALGWDDAATADAVDAGLREMFSDERFAACWDRSLLGLPEVKAWRTANGVAASAPPVKPDAPPPDAPAPAPANPGPATPTPANPNPENPTPAAGGPDVPAPPKDAQPPTVLADHFAAVDRAQNFVGPWTGWSQDIRDNKRQRRTAAKTVWFQRHEVTCEDYARYVATLPRLERQDALPSGWTLSADGDPSFPDGRARTPVTGVTLAQAWAYAASLGMRLPTEDEWDRAAAGGEKEPRTFPWGEDAARSWIHRGDDDDGPSEPAAVDGAPDDATPDGIVGLAGNVSELTATTPDRKDLGPKPPKPDAQLEIVIRGGNWKSRASDCVTSYRWVIASSEGAAHVGFRCVMDDAEYRKRFR